MKTAPEMTKQVEVAYKDAIDNLMFLKRQQWYITNYSILAQAAIAVSSDKAGPNMTAFLVTLSLVLVLFSIFVIWNVQGSMQKFRNRIAYIYATYFSSEERQGLVLIPMNKSLLEGVFFPIMFSGICIVAWAVNLAMAW